MSQKKEEFLLSKWLYIILTAVFTLAAFICFSWGHEIHFAEKGFVIDSTLFGTYGDFIGGVLGTIFSLISVLLVIKTFIYQRDATRENSKQLKIQRFHDLFFELLHVYQSQVNELCGQITHGEEDIKYNNKDYFDIEKKLIQQRYRNRRSYEANQANALKYYMLFYIKNRTKLGAYFRTLFRIYNLIDSAELDELVKRDYLKIMRAQFTESELFFLRYNAMTFYGCNFVEYINKYNVLKHLPAFDLLEFKDWWSDLSPIERTGINIVFSSICRGIRHLLVSERKELIILPSSADEKYLLVVHSSDPSDVRISLTIATNHSNYYYELRAFDKFDYKRIQRLFDCFIKEIFIYSNFQRFNEIEDIETYSSPIKTIGEGKVFIDSGIRNKNGDSLMVKCLAKNNGC